MVLEKNIVDQLIADWDQMVLEDKKENNMDKKRFYYDRSVVYGWCVYDRQTSTPAYDACAELLPPVRQDESGTTTESPVMLTNEYVAMRLCARLNVAYKRSMKENAK